MARQREGGEDAATLAAGGNLSPFFVGPWLALAILAAALPDGRLRGPWVLVTAVGLLPVALVLAAGRLGVVLAASYYVSAFLLGRLVVRNDEGDHAQAHLLSILVFTGGAVLNPDVTYLALFVLFVFALTWALLLNHLRRDLGSERLSLPLREVVGLRLAGAVTLLTLLALLATAIVFVLFPRTPVGLGFQRPVGSGTIGLTDEVRLAGFGRLKADDRVVLRIHDRSRRHRGEGLDTYFRAHVLEVFDGTRWTASPRRPMGRPDRYVRTRMPRRDASLDVWDVEMVTDLGDTAVPVPDGAVLVAMAGRDASGRTVKARRVGPAEVRTAGRPAPPSPSMASTSS